MPYPISTMPATASRRIAALRTILHRANRAYYIDASPVMPDAEFARQLAELDRLQRQHPELDTPHPPHHPHHMLVTRSSCL